MKPLLPLLAGLLLALLAACGPGPGGTPRQPPQAVTGPQAHRVTALVLTVEGPAPGQAQASFARGGRSSVTFLARGRGVYFVSARCDGPARALTQADDLPGWVSAGQEVWLEIGPGERAQTLLDLHADTTDCTLTVTPGGRPAWTLRLRDEALANPRLTALDTPLPACGGTGRDALETAFLATGGLSATCPLPAGRATLLADGIDALNARVQALTGRALPRAALEAGDVGMPLDFSAAPQLDLIYVTYLNVNADFAGALTARMLEWHAARGTAVRILVTDVMMTETDRRLFEGLAARYPSVQIQPYRMPASAARGFDGHAGQFHRVTHVKMFATLARQPGRSVAIVGGRNLHEGYFFDQPRDLSARPDLHQYDPTQTRLTGGFTAYQDFEVAVHGDAAVGAVVRHMAALWQRDHDSQALRPPAGAAQGHAAEGTVRHFLSVPFADGQAQEDYFVGLIDAAERNLRIASPYLNLTPDLDAALRRARERGVRVEIVTTVRVREVTDLFVSNLNRMFAEDHGDWLHFVDYDPAPMLLHAKIFVIDDRLVVVTSTNLNQRSFVHDLENGLVFLDRALAARVSGVIDGWMAAGNPVARQQEVPGFVRLLMRWGAFRRGF